MVERNSELEDQETSRDPAIEELGAEFDRLTIQLGQKNIVANATGWDYYISFIGEDMPQNTEEVDNEDGSEEHAVSSNISQLETSGLAQLPVTIGTDLLDSDDDFVYQLTYDPQKVIYMADYMMAFLRETESLEHEKNKGRLAIGNVRKRALEMQSPKKQVSIDSFFLAG